MKIAIMHQRKHPLNPNGYDHYGSLADSFIQGTGTLVSNLNADMLDGLHAFDFTLDRILGYGNTTTKDMTVNNLTVTGNLTVQGTTTTINTTELTVEDNIITLNSGETGAGVTAGTSGIEIDRGTLSNAQILFDETNDEFQFKYADGTYTTINALNIKIGGAEVIDSSRNLIGINSIEQTLNFNSSGSDYWLRIKSSGTVADQGGLELHQGAQYTIRLTTLGTGGTSGKLHIYSWDSSSSAKVADIAYLYVDGHAEFPNYLNTGYLNVSGSTVINSSLEGYFTNLVNKAKGTADATTTLYNSYQHILRGSYWDGSASQSYDITLQNVMTSTTPTAKLSIQFAGTEKAYIDSSGKLWTSGDVQIGSDKILDSGGNTVISFNGTGNTAITGTLSVDEIKTYSDTYLHFTTSTARDIGADIYDTHRWFFRVFEDANSTTTLRNSPGVDLVGKYYDGTSSVQYPIKLQTVMIDTTPTAKLSISFNGSEVFWLRDDGAFRSLYLRETKAIEASDGTIFAWTYNANSSYALTLRNPSGDTSDVLRIRNSADTTTVFSVTGEGNTTIGGVLYFGSGSSLTRDQGGSIELGDSTSSGVVPYIDFHYGVGSAQDFNVRLQNYKDKGFWIKFGDGTVALDLTNTIVKVGVDLAPSTNAGYSLGTDSYLWKYAKVRYGLHAYTQGNAPRSTEDDTYKVLHAGGPTSDFIISLQDGTGRVQFYWNATPYGSDSSSNYIVTGEAAGKILFSPPGNPFFALYYAPSGTAGSSISWTTLFYINTDGTTWIKGATTIASSLSVSSSLTVGGTATFNGNVQSAQNDSLIWNLRSPASTSSATSKNSPTLKFECTYWDSVNSVSVTDYFTLRAKGSQTLPYFALGFNGTEIYKFMYYGTLRCINQASTSYYHEFGPHYSYGGNTFFNTNMAYAVMRVNGARVLYLDDGVASKTNDSSSINVYAIYYNYSYTKSALRWKEDVAEITPRIDWIDRVKPYRFRYKGDKRYTIGLVAEELPEEVKVYDIDEKTGKKELAGFDVNALLALLIHVVKDLRKRVNMIEKTINTRRINI